MRFKGKPGNLLRRALAAAALCAALLTISVAVAEEPAAWQSLSEGKAILLLRHALAPGVGDPTGFTLGDCSTQRNLNAEGIAQARRWKSLLAEKHIAHARIFSSEWCRALDTATAIDLGSVEPLAALNSFFEGRFDRATQTRATRIFVNQLHQPSAVILVTHQVNIQALTGVTTASNEGIIVSLPLTDSPVILARIVPE